MSKIENFRSGIENLKVLARDSEEVAKYMSDPNNWILVHATNYMPRKSEKGQMFIPTTAMATNFTYPRSTIHFTLNQIVSSHAGGSWNDTPIVILSPYNDSVKQNQNPIELATEDTYFSPNPDTGFVLPESVHIVEPGRDIPDGDLFVVDGNVTKYKNDKFSKTEIETILSLIDVIKREDYLNYESGNLDEISLKMTMCYWDERTKKMYNNSKDKKAFLRGMFEESRYQILSEFVRDIAVYKTMQQMGYNKVDSHEDLSSGAAADAAIKMGIMGNRSNKGHSNSLHSEIEGINNIFYWYMNEIKNISDIDSLVAYFDDADRISTKSTILRAIVSKDTINFNDECNKCFLDYKDEVLSYDDSRIDVRKMQKNYINAKTIADVDKNLAITIDRWIKTIQSEFDMLKNKIYQMPGYAESVDKLKSKLPNKIGQLNRDMSRN